MYEEILVTEIQKRSASRKVHIIGRPIFFIFYLLWGNYGLLSQLCKSFYIHENLIYKEKFYFVFTKNLLVISSSFSSLLEWMRLLLWCDSSYLLGILWLIKTRCLDWDQFARVNLQLVVPWNFPPFSPFSFSIWKQPLCFQYIGKVTYIPLYSDISRSF